MAVAADYGPAAACERRGMVCVGAGPWVVNFNVALRTTDLEAARAIARAVSTRGGAPGLGLGLGLGGPARQRTLSHALPGS